MTHSTPVSPVVMPAAASGVSLGPSPAAPVCSCPVVVPNSASSTSRSVLSLPPQVLVESPTSGFVRFRNVVKVSAMRAPLPLHVLDIRPAQPNQITGVARVLRPLEGPGARAIHLNDLLDLDVPQSGGGARHRGRTKLARCRGRRFVVRPAARGGCGLLPLAIDGPRDRS